MIYLEVNVTDPFFCFALEHYLIHERPPEDEGILLLWRTEPTLMVGRFQNTLGEIDAAYARDKGIHVVRRVTGGGTIYTDPGGWQFSFITRAGTKQIDFSPFILPVAQALRRMGADVAPTSRNDLTAGGKKISGNAQRIFGKYVLHHGSLLFDTDLDQLERCLTPPADKMASKGIQSVKDRVTNLKEHLPGMDTLSFRDALSSALCGDGERMRLTPEDEEQIERIARERFRPWDWNFGASPAFTVTRRARFAGGGVELCLCVEQGIITVAALYGDFFAAGDVSHITDALTGLPYRRDALEQAAAGHDFGGVIHGITAPELTGLLCRGL